MAPQAATKSFFLSTRWVVAATSSGAVTSTQRYKMSAVTFCDNTSLVV